MTYKLLTGILPVCYHIRQKTACIWTYHLDHDEAAWGAGAAECARPPEASPSDDTWVSTVS